jgi:hypothetical protein
MRAIARAHQNRNLTGFKDGACFSRLLFSSLTVVLYRALLGPNDPLSPRRSVRHPPQTESPADRPALLGR